MQKVLQRQWLAGHIFEVEFACLTPMIDLDCLKYGSIFLKNHESTMDKASTLHTDLN